MTRRLRGEHSSGQSLAEFALVLPIFLLMLFGLIDVGRFVFTANALGNGAREAARFASVGTRPAECAGLTRSQCATAIAQSHSWGVPSNGITVTVTCEQIAANGTRTPIAVNSCTTRNLLRVEAQTQFTILTPVIGQFIGNLTIGGDSRVTVNQ
jgi:Flp pilus assembly protein TadG